MPGKGPFVLSCIKVMNRNQDYSGAYKFRSRDNSCCLTNSPAAHSASPSNVIKCCLNPRNTPMIEKLMPRKFLIILKYADLPIRKYRGYHKSFGDVVSSNTWS